MNVNPIYLNNQTFLADSNGNALSLDKTHIFEMKFIKNLNGKSLVHIFDKTAGKPLGTFLLNATLQSKVVYDGKFVGDRMELSLKTMIKEEKTDIVSRFVEHILDNPENDKKSDLFGIINNMFFHNETGEKINNEKEKKFSQFTDKDDNYYFVFNLPVYEIPSKMVIKIDKNKNVMVNLYLSKHLTEDYRQNINEVFDILQKSLRTKTNSYNYCIYYEFEKFRKTVSQYFSENQVDLLG
jgi:hypothetical protein